MVSVQYRNEKTKSGYDFDLVKSALQKYIRRCDPLKAYNMYQEIKVFKTFSSLVKLIFSNEKFLFFMNIKSVSNTQIIFSNHHMIFL
jgi:hypothetical protein